MPVNLYFKICVNVQHNFSLEWCRFYIWKKKKRKRLHVLFISSMNFIIDIPLFFCYILLPSLFYFFFTHFTYIYMGVLLYKCLFFHSKKINSLSDTTTTSTTMTFAQQQQHPHHHTTSTPAAHLKSPRKSWSSIAYNNKNFPDKKLGYEQHSITTNTNNTNNKYFNKGYNKFERSGQDVMARASQIVQ